MIITRLAEVLFNVVYRGTMQVDEDVTLNKNLTVANDTLVGHDLAVAHDAQVGNNLTVIGEIISGWLTGQFAALTSAMTSADSTLQSNIDSAQSTLQSNINGVQSSLNSYKTSNDAAVATKAPTNSPALTGTPTAPTATAGTNTTQLATTAFVTGAVGTLSSSTTSALAAKAPLDSPSFSGNPTAPTPASGDNDTSIATTAFVKAQGYATQSFVTSQGYLTSSSGLAPLNSPAFTGNPTAPTPFTGDGSTHIATCEFVKAQGYTVSDINVKFNIAPSSQDFGERIDALEFVDFEYIDEPGVEHTGLIAQATQKVWPELVKPGEDGKPWSIIPKEAILPMLQEIQALRRRVAALEERLA